MAMSIAPTTMSALPSAWVIEIDLSRARPRTSLAGAERMNHQFPNSSPARLLGVTPK